MVTIVRCEICYVDLADQDCIPLTLLGEDLVVCKDCEALVRLPGFRTHIEHPR